MTDIGQSYDDLLESLRGEFVDEAEDNLNVVEITLENLRSGQEDPAEALVKIQRPVHSLKGSSSVANFPLVAVIMHRMEDYMSPLKAIEPEHIEHLQLYVDTAREYAQLDVDQASISSADLVRTLPKRPDEEVLQEAEKVGGKRIEAMMVIKEKTAGMIFERELKQAGLHVTTIRKPFDVFEMLVRTKPDLLVLSGVIGELSGVDIACAIKAMPKTATTPVCIMTSFERNHPDLAGLPEEVALISKNNLKTDLAAVVEKLR